MEKQKHGRRSFEFVNGMPLNVMELEEYNGHLFNRYYWDIDKKRLLLSVRNDRLKVVKPLPNAAKFEVIPLIDVNGKVINVGYSKFVKLMEEEITSLRSSSCN